MTKSITSVINNKIEPTPVTSKAQDLKELKELLDQGILTQEEFAEQKASILRR